MAHHLIENSVKSFTRFEAREMNLLWTIENFSLCDKKNKEEFQSQVFPKLKGDQREWRLRLFPRGFSDRSKDYLSVYLQCYLNGTTDVTAEYTFNCQDKDGNILVTKEPYSHTFTANASSRGHGDFIERGKLISLLKDDVLIINCLVKWINGVNSNEQVLTNEFELKNDWIKNLYQLMDKGSFSDITLLANDGTEFPAHKFMLAAHSPIFAEMFKDESKENNNSRILIKDISASTLKTLLQFIYTNRFDEGNTEVEGLLVAADSYALSDLKILCEKELVKQLTVNNAAGCLLLANRHNAETLKEKSLKLVATNLKEVLNTDAMKSLVSTCPSLYYDTLKAVAGEM